MKKKRKVNPRFILLLVLAAALLIVLLMRFAMTADPAAGSYTGFGFFADGEGWLCGSEFSAELYPGGRGTLSVFGTDYSVKWSRSGDTVTIRDSGGKYKCPYENGILTMTVEGAEGTVTIIFTQDDVYSFDTSADETLGTYAVTRCYDSTGKDYAPQNETLTLYPDGLGSFDAYDFEDPFTWTLDGNVLTVTMDGTETAGTLENGAISIQLGNYLFDFSRDGASVSDADASEESAEAPEESTDAVIGSYTAFGYTADGIGWVCEDKDIRFAVNADHSAVFTDSDGDLTGTWTDEDGYAFLQGDDAYTVTYDPSGLLTLAVDGEDSELVYWFTQDGVYSESDGDSPIGSYTCTACYDGSGADYVVEDETLTLCAGGIGRSYLMGYNNLIFWSVDGTSVTVHLDNYTSSDDFSDGVITLALGSYIYDFAPD